MPWCKITAIVSKLVLEKVERELQQVGVPGITVTDVKGYGEYKDLFVRDWSVAHVRIEIFVQRTEAQRIVQAIAGVASTGEFGDGIIAILPVDEFLHIRAGAPVTAPAAP